MIRYLSAASSKKVSGVALLRLDFNTEDDWRMRAVVPTITFLLKRSKKIVIMSHQGRPVGFDRKFSLRKKIGQLEKLIGRKILFAPDFDFRKIKMLIDKAPSGSIILLENLRFNPGEEKNDRKFAGKLASLGDFYVNDAFAVSHRANASVVAITKFLPSYAGLELQLEISSLSRAVKNPKHPLVIIVGGAKAADKLGVLTYFRNKADSFLLGGGSGNTMLALRGDDVKKSARDTDSKKLKTLQRFVRAKNVLAPIDVVWHGQEIWDIGPKTIRQFSAIIAKARTIFWGGPMGPIERPANPRGSVAIARAITKNRQAFSISGGGETVMLLKQYKLDKKFSFISTGGGAMIDFLAGEKLPGIAALDR